MSNNLKTVVLQGEITATTSKQGRFKSEDPRKTAYLKLDEVNSKKAVAFGLQEYISNDGVAFFIVKMSPQVTVYTPQEPIKIDCSLDGANFSTSKVGVALLKGKGEMNEYIRLYALNVSDYEQEIEFVEQHNPFITE